MLPNNIASGIPVQNAWYLLLYARDMAAWRDNWNAQAEGAPHLLGLLARVLCKSTRKLLRNQLRRSFVRTAAPVRGIRGRIDFAVSLKHQSFERGVVDCVFPELSTDTVPNRIIRSTLARLASEPALKSDDRGAEKALRHELRTLVREMEGIKLTLVSTLDFASLQFGRNDRDYAVPVAICRLIHTLSLPTEASGDETLAALLHDEILFNKLFERFVRNFYRLHLTNCSVDGERLDWGDELGSGLVPMMYTDITIEEKELPFRRTVVDTKYSTSTLAESRSGELRFKSQNLYQIYSYLRTQEHKSSAHRCARGVLLYPTNGYDVHDAMLVQGHRIDVVTVNLARQWQHIEKELLNLFAA
jgi:5-methylcytosine-specific restriction enzyme subunit McrC